MLRPPVFPCRVEARQDGELRSCHRAGDGFLHELRPETLGLAVVHDQSCLVEFARHAEGESLAINDRVVHDARTAERSPGDEDRPVPHPVINDLMPVENLDRISFGRAGEGNA